MVTCSHQDHCTATALQMAYLLGYDSLLRGGYPVRPICTSAAPERPTLSSLYSLFCVCSGPLVKNGAEHINCLHKSYSLPGEIKLPGQDASPPVKVPKGMRSNRLRRQGPNAATALGVKKTGGTRVAKSSSTVQDEFIKVCPHHHHQVTIISVPLYAPSSCSKTLLSLLEHACCNDCRCTAPCMSFDHKLETSANAVCKQLASGRY